VMPPTTATMMSATVQLLREKNTGHAVCQAGGSSST